MLFAECVTEAASVNGQTTLVLLPGAGAPAFTEESEDAEGKVEALGREPVQGHALVRSTHSWFTSQAILGLGASKMWVFVSYRRCSILVAHAFRLSSESYAFM